ncbi:4-hydroxybenzoate octaprenyltransferase [Aquicella lusitana]|uniref:4-hydroxybenzoate octaprenyltransferase n=1 Tax=Aquicella lusitana TaxID=254246 RepID=A0A370GZB1_9COXI|nr:4-hydroxybenzoate octaprenyltransferase [Aquicella lusitana]RDI48636.1 4-hydroxybenzoate polyprenyltransferase [Aquicella lusitana]VVC73987.1 4-hydroxybenzoate octaprenyltransferase [Aquicella lusitana]
MQIRERLPQYVYLMRLDKPIGVLLLLWPTLWALWLASHGRLDSQILLIFVTGVVLMRSAGCVVNDFADRHFDGHVKRTRERPLASGRVKPVEALVLAALLALTAFAGVLLCNALTIKLAFIGAALTIIYPLMKRYTHLPQFGLGLAFSWGVPMAFAAVTGSVGNAAWFLFLTCLIWPVIYDTMYAMVDREDDRKIGVKSTAILFDEMDTFIIGLLQMLFVVLLVIMGLMFRLHFIYYLALAAVGVLFIYQQWLIKSRDPQACFRAFKNNNWVGLLIFLGIFLSYPQ